MGDGTEPAGREAPDLAASPWHAMPAAEAARALDADTERGLAADEVERRRQRHGPNKLPESRRDTVLEVFIRQFRDPLIYVLLVAGAVSVAIGNIADAGFIFAVLLFNAGLGTYQEYKAESAAQALQQVMKITAQVRRGGERRQVDSTELVPGDLVALQAGSAVPADIRLTQARELRADESLLTGESQAVEKTAEAELAEDTPLGDRRTLVHAGSSIMGGRGRGVVVRTGEATELGRIAQSLAESGEEPPLVIRMRQFTRVIAVGVLGIIALLGLVQFLRGEGFVDIFLLAVALAVSAIPAGLPVAITVALSIGSARMSERNVIVRHLPAVEGLGACTLIASDKTGTLTENKLSVQRIRPLEDGGDVTVSGPGDRLEGRPERDGEPVSAEEPGWLRDLVIAGALCNDATLRQADGALETSGDQVDIAFLVLAGKAGLERDRLLEEHPQIGEIPFESERKFAASFHRGDGTAIALVKGAAETVAGMCAVDPDAVRAQEQALADEGYRVLAVAAGAVDPGAAERSDEAALEGLRLLGLVGLLDPVRETVPDAVEKCRHAGIQVRMITGDHPSTALSIGRRLRFAQAMDEVATGKEIGALEAGEDSETGEKVRNARIYARVEPRQKTTIVDEMQGAGHFVAVTGDGVNDAPALRMANIGVAMGKSGTDIARNAADLILTDDNFSSIVNGVEEGRRVYDNVRKVVWLLISTGVAELILFTLSVAFGTPLPLGPVQLLWLNLVTNGIQDVALAFEKGEADLLERQPRRRDERIFNRLMVEEVLVSGVYMGLVSFAVFYVLFYELGYSAFEASNLLLMLMVLFENVHIFNVRSERRSAFRVPLSNNWLVVAAAAAAQAIHIASLHIPGWRDVLNVEPISPLAWATLLGIAVTKFISVEVYKWTRGMDLARRMDQRPAIARAQPA